jgi:hypothetical protein
MAATYTTTKAQGATLDYSIALANGDTIASAAETRTDAAVVLELSLTLVAPVTVQAALAIVSPLASGML